MSKTTAELTIGTDALKSIELHITIKRSFGLDARLGLGMAIIRLGGWVAGVGRMTVE